MAEKLKRYKRLEEASDEKFKGEDFYDRLASDPVAMGEIEMYIDNNGNLYRQQFLPIIKNIQRKIKSGKYDHAFAPKLWGYLIENGMKLYAKENRDPRWMDLLSTKDRKVLAQKYADVYYDEIMRGNFD